METYRIGGMTADVVGWLVDVFRTSDNRKRVLVLARKPDNGRTYTQSELDQITIMDITPNSSLSACIAQLQQIHNRAPATRKPAGKHGRHLQR